MKRDDRDHVQVDMLADIFRRQRMLQAEQEKAGKLDQEWRVNLAVQGLAAFVELAEAMQQTPTWKTWKKTAKTNKLEFLREMADLMHFIPNLCIMHGVTAEELYAAFVAKNEVNLERIREGY